MKKAIISFIITATLLTGVKSTFGQGIGTIPQLQQWVSTTSPSTAVTQQTYGKSVRISGQTTGCAQFDSNGILTSTGGTGCLTVGSTAINSILSTNSSGVITATSTPTFGSFNATSTNATSTIAGHLDITGNLKVSGALFTPISIYSSGTVTAGNFVANNAFATSTLAGGLAIETSGFVYDYSTNNVGIGTASPAFTLDVQAAIGKTQVKSTTGSNFVYSQLVNSAGTAFLGIEGASANGLITGDLANATVLGNNYAGALQFGTNNGIRATIDSSGNIGIGTTTPIYKLQVTGDNNSGGNQIVVSGASNPNSRLYIGYDTSSNYASLQAITEGTAFRAITLNPSGGNVGIGVTAPASQLELYQTANISPQLRIGNNHFNRGIDFGYTTNTAFIQGKADIASTPINYTLALNPNGANVGVGDDSPDAKLDILQGSDAEAQGLQISRANDSDYTRIYKSPALGSLNDPLIFSSNFVADHAAIGRDGSAYFAGNVGIGTTAPGAKLEVVDTNPLKLSRTGNNSFTSAISGIMSGSGAGDLIWDTAQADGGFAWRVNNGTTLALGITEGGNVGIGTTTPLGKLQVSSGASATTTVSFGEIGNSSSKSCYNTKNNTGGDISFYFVGTSMVVENNLCR